MTVRRPKRSLSSAFKKWQADKDRAEYESICTLFDLYQEFLNLDSDVSKAERWRLFQLASSQAYELFTKLAEQDIYVVFKKQLLKERIEFSRCGPYEGPFFQDIKVIEDLLKYCLIGAPK